MWSMADKNMFDEAFPQDTQVGGSHYKHFTFNHGLLLERMV